MSRKSKEYQIHDRPISDITMLEPEGVYSYADYLNWGFEERVELIKGKLFKMSPAPTRKHQEISMRLSLEIGQFLKSGKCKIYYAPFDVRFPDKNRLSDKETFTVVQPDLCVVCDQEKLDDAGCIGAPDLIVEILSPSTLSKDLKDKFRLYEEFGVREYWVVYPDVQIVEIFYHQDGRFSRSVKYTPGDVIASSVLSGLKLTNEEVFKGIG